jgi:hypothetical protein
MSHNSQGARHPQRAILSAGIIAVATLLSTSLHGQTTSTGALAGVSLDPSGAELPAALLRLSNRETGRTKSAISDAHGRFSFLLLPPGTYQLQASKTDFEGAADERSSRAPQLISKKKAFSCQTATTRVTLRCPASPYRLRD